MKQNLLLIAGLVCLAIILQMYNLAAIGLILFAFGCVSTTSVSRKCGSTAGGLAPHIRIVLKEDVDSIPAATAGVISTDIVLKAGKDWATWEGDRNSFDLSTESGGENAISGYTPTLTFRYNGLNEAFYDYLSKNSGGEFIVVATHRDGKKRLLGNLDEGVFFTPDGIKEMSGKNAKEFSGLELKMAWEAPVLPYVYSGDFNAGA